MRTLLLLALLAASASGLAPRYSGLRVHGGIRMSAAEASAALPDPSTMKAGAIKKELEQRGVSTRSLLEKPELVAALVEARLKPMPEPEPAPPAPQPEPEAPPAAAATDAEKEQQCREKASAMRVKALRTELAKRGDADWRNCTEKRELVDLLVPYLVKEMDFSATGALQPGVVGQLDEDQVRAEMGPAPTPIIIDCYADWCGPCKMMAPELDAAAAELGSRVRVAKMDVDECQELSSELRIEAMPTILFINEKGEEIHRLQGARMKQGLIECVEHLFFGGPVPALGL